MASLVTGPSFISVSILVLGFNQGIDQKSGSQKFTHLSFAQYVETGRVRDTKVGMNVSNEMLLNAAKMLVLQLLPFLSY